MGVVVGANNLMEANDAVCNRCNETGTKVTFNNVYEKYRRCKKHVIRMIPIHVSLSTVRTENMYMYILCTYVYIYLYITIYSNNNTNKIV